MFSLQGKWALVTGATTVILIVLIAVAAGAASYAFVAKQEELPTPNMTVAEWLKKNPDAPKFEEYPVKEYSIKKSADVDLKSHPDGKLYRTKIREGFKQGATFAGKYAVAKAGCGTQCMSYWVINLETGKIIFTTDAALGASYKKDSTLFIVNSDDYGDSKEGTEMENLMLPIFVEFYALKDDEMVLVKEIPLPHIADQAQ